MKKLVNHGGVVQYKYVITNRKDLLEYCSTILSQRHANQIMNDEDGRMKQLAHIHDMSPILFGGFLTNKIYDDCLEHIKNGEIIVFNEGGGYCFWSDDDMKLLDWKYLHEISDTVVLENAEIVERDVRQYLEKIGVQDYLSLTNLNKYGDDEILYYCNKAKTIVFMTQFIQVDKIMNLVKLASQLEQKKIVIINSPNFPNHLKYLSKHIIKTIDTDEEDTDEEDTD